MSKSSNKRTNDRQSNLPGKKSKMAARLATPRNFVRMASGNSGSNASVVTNKQTKQSETQNEVISLKTSEVLDTDPESSGISIEEVIAQQKKIILQTTDSNGIAVAVPIDTPDSSNEDNGSIQDPLSLKEEVVLSQQVGAHVTVMPDANSDDSETPQFITVTVSTQEGVGGQGSYQVQYVDTDLYHNTSQNQAQMSYPFCAVGDYQTNGQSYYSTTGNYTPATNTLSSHTSGLPYIVPVDESLLLASSSQSRESPQSLTEVAYIQEAQSTPQTPTSTTTPTSIILESETSPNLANANKIASATVKWLSRNYETAEGVSLPRSTLYNHYMLHCTENKIEPVNAASFGKLIRSVFSGLRTRRLGTRGNSKYHYYGIRIKPGSNLMQAVEEKPNGAGAANSTMNKGIKKLGAKPETYEACSQFLGDGSGAIPPFPNIEISDTFNNEIILEDIEIFRSMYREHCESFLDAVLNLEFSTIELLWRDFWRSSDNNNLDECEEEKYLTKAKLYLLCQSEGIQNFIRQVDYAFYQNMVDVLIPDVLRSIPNSLTQAIRNFAKNLEVWLNESMAGCPEKVVQIKTSAVSAFCQTLRRYTSLNHLAQAARAVLQNNSQIAQMLNDLNRVDFHNVQEQAAWVCQCDSVIVQRLESDFKAALQQQNSLEQWAAWLRLVVDSALEEYRGKPNYAKAARQFLLKWSFYSSMVIRDLTLRSASSFGSFHLIRLLYDEYMFFLVEHKVAEAQQKTAIAVLSDKIQKDSEFDFEYPMDFIDSTESHANKRMKHA